MGRIDWYGPPSGPKSVEEIVGYSKPSVSALMRYSTQMAREADAIMEVHRKTGDAQIDVLHKGQAERGHRAKLDSVVFLHASEDLTKTPKGGKKLNKWRAVQSIEFGHYTSGREHEGEGPRTKADHRRHWAKGIAPLQKAAKKMVAKRRLSI